MEPVLTRNIAKSILEILGLENHKVCSLNIDFPIDGIVTVHVSFYPDAAQLDETTTLLIGRYELHEKE